MLSQRGGSLVGRFEFVRKSRDITCFSTIFESLAIIMYNYDLNFSFRTFKVCFLYQVKDSDKCFDKCLSRTRFQVLSAIVDETQCSKIA